MSKEAHIQDGEEFSQQALRVSKALGQFRWNIEAPCVIGALFEDIVSVQAQAGPITKDVIEKIEDLGYHFIAVDAPNGRVTAWFKKVGEGDSEGGGSSAAEYAKLGAFRGAFSLGIDAPRAREKGEKTQP